MPDAPVAPFAPMDAISESDPDDDELPAPVLERPGLAVSSRPASKASATPAKTAGKTPVRQKGVARRGGSTGGPTPGTAGRKRKADVADEPAGEPTPAKKRRGRPARAAATTASARLAARAAKLPKRGRPKGAASVCCYMLLHNHFKLHVPGLLN